MRAAGSDIDMDGLARRMVSLQEDAFLEFAKLFGPRFRKLFMARGLNLTDAEDLAVSCVTDIALKVDKYRPTNDHFEAWVFTLARHYLVDWWRSRHPGVQLSDDLPPIPFEPLEPNFELIAAVKEAMKRISESDQTIIRVKNMGGEYSFAEVAKLIGISAGAARIRHFRALRRLEDELMKDERIRTFLEKRKALNREERSI